MKNRIRTATMSFSFWAAVCLLPWQVSQARSVVIKEQHIINTISVSYNRYDPTDSIKDKASTAPCSCRKNSCNVYVDVDKTEQMMYVYISGELQYTFPVSTGRPGHPTPDMDLRPQGPLYVKYTSTKYPNGDYEGLGNMPYVVFLKDGYAIHGTTPGSISKLGKKASHGCIRLHPDDARTFYDLVKSVGLGNTWVTVHE